MHCLVKKPKFCVLCSQRVKIACKIRDEYAALKDFKAPEASARSAAGPPSASGANGAVAPAAAPIAKSTTAKLIESMPAPADS